MEMVKDASTKIKYIYNGKAAILLGDYVLRYQELLFKMYQYQILLKNMDKASQDFRLTLEEEAHTVGDRRAGRFAVPAQSRRGQTAHSGYFPFK